MNGAFRWVPAMLFANLCAGTSFRITPSNGGSFKIPSLFGSSWSCTIRVVLFQRNFEAAKFFVGATSNRKLYSKTWPRIRRTNGKSKSFGASASISTEMCPRLPEPEHVIRTTLRMTRASRFCIFFKMRDVNSYARPHTRYPLSSPSLYRSAGKVLRTAGPLIFDNTMNLEGI